MSTLSAARTFSTVAQSRSLTLLADSGSENNREILLASAGSLEGLLSPRLDPQWGLYLQPVHSTTARSSHGGGEGYNADLTGLELGLDRKIGRHWVLGVMAGMGAADIAFNGSSFVSNDTEEQTLYTLGAYAGYSLDDWLFTDTLSATYVDQSSKRNAGLSQTAAADYDSWLTRNQLLAVYRWTPFNRLEIAPRAGLDLTYLHRGGFAETGATNAVSYGDLDKVFADASLGLRATRSWTLDSGVEMSLYLGGDVVHSLGSGDITVRQYLPTASAQVTTKNDADRFNAECGLKFGQGPASFTLGYNGQFGNTTDSHAVFGMLRMEF
jgi:outer membrane autotransporter barrel domain